MEKNRRLEAIKNRQKKQAEFVEKIEGQDERLAGLLEKFVSDFDVLLRGGLELKPGGTIDDVRKTIEEFGVEADSFVERIARTLSNITELDIPSKIELAYDKTIGEQLKDLKLELPQELTEKINILDERIATLAKVLSTKQAPSKRVEDYQPVRIVVGPESDLRYLLDMPSSFGGGGTIGGATSAKQDEIISELQTLNSLVPSQYDYISLSYTGDNLTGVVFKTGGSGGTTVSTLTLAYSGSNLTSVTKT